MSRFLLVLLLLVPASAVAETRTERRSKAAGGSTLDRAFAEFGTGKTIRGKGVRGYVAFTFDDGPHEEATPRILDTLDKFDVPATFFAVGWRISSPRPGLEDRKKVLSDVVGRGHTVGNHTFKHHNLSEMSTKRMRREVDSTAALLTPYLGHRPVLFRPPFGATNSAARRHVQRRGYTMVRWNIDPKDFQKKHRSTLRARTVASILASGGGVVLLHDTKEWTADALPGILADLEAANCQRLAAGEKPIIPVSLHYFMENGSRHRRSRRRAIPKPVAARTARYRERLATLCDAAAKTEGTSASTGTAKAKAKAKAKASRRTSRSKRRRHGHKGPKARIDKRSEGH